jgi:outer membrane protein assembly factor BamB
LKVFLSSCRSDGGLCKPLWKTVNSSFGSQPVYSEGRVYVTRGIDEVAAYRARCNRGDDCRPETVWKVPDAIGIAVSGGRLYAATTQSILVFDATCPTGAGCPAVWQTPDLGGKPSVPAVADGLVFFTAGDTVYAVREDCGSGGETCPPIWHERVPGTPGTLSPPTVTARAVYVESTSGSLYSFEVPAR